MVEKLSSRRESLGAVVVVPVVVATLLGGMFSEAIAARRPSQPAAQPTFTDLLTFYDTARWSKADGWINGSPFDNVWRAGNVAFPDGGMTIRLDDNGAQGEPYGSGEYRTNGFYGYGCYEARFRPIRQPGVVTSFFTFAGPYDNGGNGRHNEIDIEFLGRDTSSMQANFWTNDDRYVSNNAVEILLGFDASLAMHDYGFKWTVGGIAWYVDGRKVHEVSDSRRVPTPKATDSLHKIMMNVWPVDATASDWAGTFSYQGPVSAQYEWVRYDSAPGCGF